MKVDKGKVLIAAPVHPVLLEGLEAAGYIYLLQEQITQQDAFELLADCVGVVTSTRLLLDKELIDVAPRLKWIARMGSGMEVIDVAYAATRNIACFSSPKGNSNAVAEHALGMLLSLNKKIVVSSEEVRAGKWLREENRGIELEGKTIGIIGFGNAGSTFAKRLSGFDVKLLAYDKYDTSRIASPVTHCPGLEPIFEQADVISFHVPLQDDTVHYFDDNFLQKMQKRFVLMNTSRGKVVQMGALYNGLQSGKIRGACLDVVDEEPPTGMDAETKRKYDEMLLMKNVIITPHIAGYSYEAIYKMSKILLERIVIAE
jgi:D-3-phosphoglycerate dehydrogenase